MSDRYCIHEQALGKFFKNLGVYIEASNGYHPKGMEEMK